MIPKFATVCAGHVDLPDRGQDATPANERRVSRERVRLHNSKGNEGGKA